MSRSRPGSRPASFDQHPRHSRDRQSLPAFHRGPFGARLAASIGLLLLIAVSSITADDWDPYPLTRCVVQESVVDAKSEIFEVKGREIRVCCEQCLGQFNDDPDRWLELVDEQIIKQQTPFYPLETCAVDGKSLKETFPVEVVFRNRLFRLCSDACHAKLKAEPGPPFEALNRAVLKKQKVAYPLTKCLVSGKPLGAKAIDHVVANQLIRLAGPEQLDKFEETPGSYLEKLRALRKGGKPAKP